MENSFPRLINLIFWVAQQIKNILDDIPVLDDSEIFQTHEIFKICFIFLDASFEFVDCVFLLFVLL